MSIERIIKIAEDVSGKTDLFGGTNIDALGLESIDFWELLTNLEDEFEIEIADHEASQWVTLEDVANYLSANSD